MLSNIPQMPLSPNADFYLRLFGEFQARQSSVCITKEQRQFNAMVDQLDEKEFSVAMATVNGLIVAKNKLES